MGVFPWQKTAGFPTVFVYPVSLFSGDSEFFLVLVLILILVLFVLVLVLAVLLVLVLILVILLVLVLILAVVLLVLILVLVVFHVYHSVSLIFRGYDFSMPQTGRFYTSVQQIFYRQQNLCGLSPAQNLVGSDSAAAGAFEDSRIGQCVE